MRHLNFETVPLVQSACATNEDWPPRLKSVPSRVFSCYTCPSSSSVFGVVPNRKEGSVKRPTDPSAFPLLLSSPHYPMLQRGKGRWHAPWRPRSAVPTDPRLQWHPSDLCTICENNANSAPANQPLYCHSCTTTTSTNGQRRIAVHCKIRLQ